MTLDKTDARYTPKPITCKGCGLVLGYIVRRGNMRHLDVLRDPLPADTSMPEGLSFWAVCALTGAGILPCPCGTVREWHVGQDAINDLLERRAKRQ